VVALLVQRDGAIDDDARVPGINPQRLAKVCNGAVVVLQVGVRVAATMVILGQIMPAFPTRLNQGGAVRDRLFVGMFCNVTLRLSRAAQCYSRGQLYKHKIMARHQPLNSVLRILERIPVT
jgi:hypothetical protein